MRRPNFRTRPRLSIGRLVDGGALDLGNITEWRWPNGLAASITARAGRIEVVIGNGDPQSIAIERDPRRRARSWSLRCPRCTSIREQLFECDGQFRCEDCHGLRRGVVPVAWKAFALRRQIGAEEALYGPLRAIERHGMGWRIWREHNARERKLVRVRRYEARLLGDLLRFNMGLEREAAERGLP